MSGKLPSDRARSWRFAQGYLKKTGDPARVVRRAMARAKTMAGIIGIKVSILPPDAKIHDKITIDDALLATLRARAHAMTLPPVEKPAVIIKKRPSSRKAK